MTSVVTRVIALTLFVVFSTGTARAQSEAVAAHAEPEDAVRAYMEAFREADLERAAALMHPGALGSLRAILRDLVSADSVAAAVFVGTVERFDEMTPEETFVRFMDSILSIQPEMRDMMGSLDASVLGRVMEGDSLAHVVTRSRIQMNEVEVTQMQVVSARRHEGGWRVLLTGEVSKLAAAIRAQTEAEAY